ncbi:MAG: peptide chain release factor 1 [Gemmatimonadetes bacterium]|nr:MAG: peptide chain release factor 1 [Gemmatimonadota bacterium]
MIDALEKALNRYQELETLLADPNVISDIERMRTIAKEHSDLADLVQLYREYKDVLQELEGAKELLSTDDPEMRELAEMEVAELSEREEQMRNELRKLLLPQDPNDSKNTIVEIRAGTGGEEAALFAAELFRMYSKYAENKGWKIDVMSSNETGVGGLKEIIFLVEGKDVYRRLKHESGGHRVQRVPVTETSGRIHTSAATVAVLPEADEVDVEINMNDLQIDVYRASGAGGQHVNTTDSAVRMTHIPTGLVVTCQDERSQHKNRAKALKVLRARLYEKAQAEAAAEQAQARKSQVGSGDRSDKIRTYNYPQNRVTDHRIGLTLYRLNEILEGDLDTLIDALIEDEQVKRLEAQALST